MKSEETIKRKLTCHCNAVEIELTLPRNLSKVRRCNCSMCRRRGALASSVPLSDLKIVHGHDKLTLYQFNTRTAKHYFCSVCGVYTHHQRRSNPTEFAFNVGCVEGLDPFHIATFPCWMALTIPLIERSSCAVH